MQHQRGLFLSLIDLSSIYRPGAKLIQIYKQCCFKSVSYSTFIVFLYSHLLDQIVSPNDICIEQLYNLCELEQHVQRCLAIALSIYGPNMANSDR